jgi:hypothetical protein
LRLDGGCCWLHVVDDGEAGVAVEAGGREESGAEIAVEE